MLRYVSVLGLLIAVLVDTAAFALTNQQKLETCTFGADDQKLTGQARKTFMTRCMANEDRPAVRTAPQQQK
jgi:psiF repeat